MIKITNTLSGYLKRAKFINTIDAEVKEDLTDAFLDNCIASLNDFLRMRLFNLDFQCNELKH